jgi:hypothetical protein
MGRIKSSVCREQDFYSDWYHEWRKVFLEASPELNEAEKKFGKIWTSIVQGKYMHRKLWEWSAIAQILKERDMLFSGKEGLGFAVGTEPLPSLFASMGCAITATDYVDGSESENWQETGQLSGCLTDVHWPKMIDVDTFRERVSFRSVDMNKIDDLPRVSYDFLWSSCALEHLGSLEKGVEFILKSLDCLKPGGVAVHTTEYNVSSNSETIEHGGSVIYRQCDLESLGRRLRLHGAAIETLDFDAGAEPGDIDYDLPPYYVHGRQHIKLLLHEHVSTSILLIIRKGNPAEVLCAKKADTSLAQISIDHSPKGWKAKVKSLIQKVRLG